jgi:murein DD-endopeptidase MepM/ murein hydrolase activator NlpD
MDNLGIKLKPVFIAIMIFLSLPVAVLADIALPVENGVITSGVGLRVDPFGSGKLVYHRGIDIAVPVGTPVRATRKGQIVFAGPRSGYGSTVIVEHANGDRTLYGHNSVVRVQLGDLVDSGTVVAFSGNTGRSTGPHVHFEQLPSGRPIIETVETEETALPQVVNNSNQRYLLEQKMEESVNSILRTINRTAPVGQGG